MRHRIRGKKLNRDTAHRIALGRNLARALFTHHRIDELRLTTVCEEAKCPNRAECWSRKTATFMIMGDICTRRCPFCDVGHGRPNPLDADEPRHLGETIAALKLKYVVITSVDRDDLRDGGARHFVEVLAAVRRAVPVQQQRTRPEQQPRLRRIHDAL